MYRQVDIITELVALRSGELGPWHALQRSWQMHYRQ